MKIENEPKREKISIWTIICICLIAALVYLSTGGIWEGSAKMKTVNLAQNRTTVASDIEAIQMDLEDVNAVIHLAQTDAVEIVKAVSDDEDEEFVSVISNGSKILVQVKHSKKEGLLGLFKFGNFGERSIEMNIPKDFRGNLQITGASGDIDIADELIVSDCIITTASGDITLGDVTAESQIRTTSGEISIGKLVGERHTLESTSGDMYIEEIEGECNIRGVSGEFDAEKLSGYGKMQFTSGDVYIETMALEGDLDIETVSGEVEIDFTKDSSAELIVDSTSGDIRGNVSFESSNHKKHYAVGEIGSGSPHQVNIQTVSGEIYINQD